MPFGELAGAKSFCCLQKMQELLSEHEGIRQDYDMLEGDYMLVVSELSAARDRIAKLLTHLQKWVLKTIYSIGRCFHKRGGSRIEGLH